MPDPVQTFASSLSSPLQGGFVITPSDSTDLPQVTRQIRITGNPGTLAVIWAGGEQTVEPVSAGDVLDWRVTRVRATGTTATGIRGYY